MTDPLLPKHPDAPSRGFLFRRGMLVGAACGMLAGLVWIGIGIAPDGANERDNIVRWRNCILVGAAAGAVVGLIRPLPPAETDHHD